MFQRIQFKKTLTCLPKSCWSSQFVQFSNDSIKDESNIHEEEVSRLLEDSATFTDASNKNWATSPYPKDVPLHQKQDVKPCIDPKDTSVFLFPGQGTIKVGMAKKYIQFPPAKELFEMANEILNYNLLKLCLDGPQEKLNKTLYNQAATVVLSLAALEVVRETTPKAFETCVATAGYSVGEITALIFSGVISFEDGVRLVWHRGQAMQFAADLKPQGMLAISCTPSTQLSKACTEAVQWATDKGVEKPICRTAIFLHTEKKILAGDLEALHFIEKHQEKFGLANVNYLPVSGAFHTPLMEPALKLVFKALSGIEINEPRCQVYSNYKAQPYSNLRFVKKFLLKQIVSSVKWEQCMQRIYHRPLEMPFPQTYDVGSGGRMRAILKLINGKASKSCTAI